MFMVPQEEDAGHAKALDVAVQAAAITGLPEFLSRGYGRLCRADETHSGMRFVGTLLQASNPFAWH